MEVKYRKSGQQLVCIKVGFKICKDGRAKRPNKKAGQTQSKVQIIFFNFFNVQFLVWISILVMEIAYELQTEERIDFNHGLPFGLLQNQFLMDKQRILQKVRTRY